MSEANETFEPQPRAVLYTDGTRVKEGDRLRTHQAPGGMLPPPSDVHGNVIWCEGVACREGDFHGYSPERREEILSYCRKNGTTLIHPDTLVLVADDGSGKNIAGHVNERV